MLRVVSVFVVVATGACVDWAFGELVWKFVWIPQLGEWVYLLV